jgi:tetratricopeptide (TPR) repeat protein
MKFGSRAFGLTSLLLACAASAQVSDEDSQAADRLFTQGRQLMRAKRFAEACEAFERSQKLDPGLGTLLNLGDCYEEVGRFASAWRVFKQAEDQGQKTHDPKRSLEARQRALALEPRLTRLRITAPPSTRLTLDGVDLPGRERVEVPVDPGPHDLRAASEGFPDWKAKVEVPAGSLLQHVRVPPFELAVATPLPDPRERSRPPAFITQPTQPPPGNGPAIAGTALTVGGAALAGVGIAGVVYSLNLSAAVTRQQPGGPDYGHPTVTYAQYQQLSWLYPGSIAAASVGGAAVLGGVYVFVHNAGSGAGASAGVGGRF